MGAGQQSQQTSSCSQLTPDDRKAEKENIVFTQKLKGVCIDLYLLHLHFY